MDEYVAAYSAHDLDRLLVLFDDAAVFESDEGVDEGKEAIRARFASQLTAFPDLTITRSSLAADGSKAAVELMMNGTHSGNLTVKGITLPATGKPVTLPVGLVISVDDDEQIIEVQQYGDRLTGLIQLGVVPGEPPKWVSPTPGETPPPSTASWRAAIDAYTTAYNAHDLDALLALYADAVVYAHPNGVDTGLDALRARIEQQYTAMPDVTIGVVEVVEEGQRAAVREVVRGTNTGPINFGGATPIPPTGKPFELRALMILTFDDTGKIVEERDYWDNLTGFGQLGLLPI